MKILGVIGGLGPMATAYFYKRLVQMHDAAADQEHMEVIIHAKPQIPDRTKYILGQSRENPLPDLLEIGRGLVREGAELIAIPCITAHFFHKELEEGIGIPVIHAVEETASYLKNSGIRKVGIFATEGTIQSRLFEDTLSVHNIECIVPKLEDRGHIMHIIYDNVKAGKRPEIMLLKQVSDRMFASGVEVILLACTELSVIKNDFSQDGLFLDVMDVLAKKAVEDCGRLKEEYKNLTTV